MEPKITGNQDTGKRFRIHWQNLDRYGFGKSTKTFTKDAADGMAAILNRDYPKIKHTVEPV